MSAMELELLIGRISINEVVKRSVQIVRHIKHSQRIRRRGIRKHGRLIHLGRILPVAACTAQEEQDKPDRQCFHIFLNSHKSRFFLFSSKRMQGQKNGPAQGLRQKWLYPVTRRCDIESMHSSSTRF